MITSKAEYEDIITSILDIAFSGHIPTAAIIPHCTPDDFDNVLEYCVERGFIKGLEIYRDGGGHLHFDVIQKPHVTFEGIAFMESIEQAKALEIANSANNKSIAAMLKANKSYILSAISIAITLIINLDKIVHNVRKVLSYLSTL